MQLVITIETFITKWKRRNRNKTDIKVFHNKTWKSISMRGFAKFKKAATRHVQSKVTKTDKM